MMNLFVKNPLAPLRSEAGFGIVEILIATGFVAALVGTAVYMSGAISNSRNEKSVDRFNCSMYATSLMARIRANSGATSVPLSNLGATAGSYFHPYQGQRLPPAGDATHFNHTQVVGAGDLTWPAGIPEILTSPAGTEPVAANALLLDGPVRTVNALYNSGTDFTNFNTTATLTALASYGGSDTFQNLTVGGVAPTTDFRIRVYNLDSGQVPAVQPVPPLWIYPRGMKSAAGVDQANVNGFVRYSGDANARTPLFGKPATYSDQYGFLVEVRVQYKDPSAPAVQKECIVSQRFAYDRDLNPPPPPSVVISNISAPAIVQHTHSVSIEVTYDSAAIERGAVLLCRDRSTLYRVGGYPCYDNSGTVGPGPQQGLGTQGPPGNDVQRTVGPIGDRMAPGVSEEAVPYAADPLNPYYDNDRPAALGNTPNTWRTNSGGLIATPASDWVPCERVTLCGVAPAASVTYNPLGNGGLRFTNSYSNVRSECIIRIEAAAIDVAGNLAGANAGGRYNPSQVTPSAMSGSSAVTPRPRCGSWCYDAASPVNSYWINAGSCCVGTGCVRGQAFPGGPVWPVSVDSPARP